MIATTHTTSKQRKNLLKGKGKFDYKTFSDDLKKFKEKNEFTYMDIALQTNIGMSLIVQIVNGKYKSDLTIIYACVLSEWMKKNICNYFN